MSWISFLQPFGIDLFCLNKKFLVFNLLGRNLKIKYRRSFLGMFWTLLNPLAMTAMYYFVFKVVLKADVPNYPIFVLAGVLPWTFFSQTILEGMESIVGNFGLISKVPVPLQVFSYAGAITNLVTFGISLPVLLGAALIAGIHLGASLILLPYYIGCLFLMAYGFSVILSIGFVYFRDLRHIMAIVMQIWFYGTPVLYNESMVPQKYRFALSLNPVATIFAGIHKVLMSGQWPAQNEVYPAAIWATATIAVTALLHRTVGRNVVENI